jgi:hypothetical protein
MTYDELYRHANHGIYRIIDIFIVILTNFKKYEKFVPVHLILGASAEILQAQQVLEY